MREILYTEKEKREKEVIALKKENWSGVSFAIAAYTLWGILPVYWKLVDRVLPLEVLANRIVWAFLFTVLLITFTKQWTALKLIFQDRKQVILILFASMFIAFNWGLYIWAVNTGKIVDASLGYYINPLVAVLLGVFVFKETLDRWTIVSLWIAFLGVLIKTIQYGNIPWVSLGLAISFGIYGAMKKMVKANSIAGLTLETAMLTPLALGYILVRNSSGLGAYQVESTGTLILLMASGLVTAIPLLLFSSAAQRLPMSLLGFTQYIAPTISLLLGVFVYHEQFTHLDLIAFCLIWIALGIYTFSQLQGYRKSKVLTPAQ